MSSVQTYRGCYVHEATRQHIAVLYHQVKERDAHTHTYTKHTHTQGCNLPNTDEWCSHNIVEYTMVYSCTALGNELL